MSEKRDIQHWIVRLSDSTERQVSADAVTTLHDGNELRMHLDGRCIALFFHPLAAVLVPDGGAT